MYRPNFPGQQQPQQQQQQQPPTSQHQPTGLQQSGVQQGFPTYVQQPGLVYVQPAATPALPSLPSLPSAQSYLQGGQNWTYTPPQATQSPSVITPPGVSQVPAPAPPPLPTRLTQQHVLAIHQGNVSTNDDLCQAKDSNVTVGTHPAIYTGQSFSTPPGTAATQVGDTVTPHKTPTADQGEMPDDTYILHLSSKDFFNPAIQHFLTKNSSPTLSPSQSSTGNSGVPSPGKQPEPDLTVDTTEQVVKPKQKQKSKRQLSKDEAFVPKNVSVKQEKNDDDSDDGVINLDDDSQDGTKKDDIKPPKPLSPAEANGQRLTDG